MNSLSFILGFNNHILYFLSRSPPVFCDVTLSFTYFRRLFHGLFKTLQKNDFSSWSYRPYNEILPDLYFCLAQLYRESPSQIAFAGLLQRSAAVS